MTLDGAVGGRLLDGDLTLVTEAFVMKSYMIILLAATLVVPCHVSTQEPPDTLVEAGSIVRWTTPSGERKRGRLAEPFVRPSSSLTVCRTFLNCRPANPANKVLFPAGEIRHLEVRYRTGARPGASIGAALGLLVGLELIEFANALGGDRGVRLSIVEQGGILLMSAGVLGTVGALIGSQFETWLSVP